MRVLLLIIVLALVPLLASVPNPVAGQGGPGADPRIEALLVPVRESMLKQFRSFSPRLEACLVTPYVRPPRRFVPVREVGR